jgi:hypothetical protein|tara:strand:- start:464 stop:688 length:225 start_codon:yes stop_codon:yes gene_type:complete
MDKLRKPYDTRPAYTLMKLDCYLQSHINVGWCDIVDLHEFIILFRTLPKEHQKRYGFMVDLVADLFDEAEQPCS